MFPGGGVCRSPDSGSADSTRAAQSARRKRDDRGKEAQDALDGNPQEAERQQNEPYDRVEEEGEQRQRPAENEQYDPEQKRRHSSLLYGRSSRKFFD